MRKYIVLVEDEYINDVLVFAVEASSASSARTKVANYYIAQGWFQHIGSMRSFILKDKEIQHVGNTYADTHQKMKEEIRTLYEKLFYAGRMCEGEGDIHTYDDILEFMRESPVGCQVIEDYEQGTL
jgi:hypothetical protein